MKWVKWSEIRGEGRGRVVYLISSLLKGVGFEYGVGVDFCSLGGMGREE
jgi:hypothetical protein